MSTSETDGGAPDFDEWIVETNWLEIGALFTGAGVNWDGASFYLVTAPDGGPLENNSARLGLRAIEARAKAEPSPSTKASSLTGMDDA